MSSTDKTKFNITETSKQANVDITSDKVQLPADTADHTLVAIVPSNANCTSGVNVEVEMSPDGENWCPALRKETVTTACLLYTSPSPRDRTRSRMPSSA